MMAFNFQITWCFVIFFLQGTCSWSHFNRSSIPYIIPQNSSLTVTSFQFNPTSQPSDWIERIFGSKSIFYTRKTIKSAISDHPLSIHEVNDRVTALRKYFTLPTTAIWPACSMEILAFGLIGVSLPLMEESKFTSPSFGNAILRVLHISRSITCYYRGLYENWRYNSELTKPNYWSIVFYCPVQNATTCNKIKDYEENISTQMKPLRLVMYLEKQRWISSFKANFYSASKLNMFISSSLSSSVAVTQDSIRNLQSEGGNMNKYRKPPTIGVCVAIPYTSNDIEKRIANEVILLDWVRYYVKLNFKVMIYDRNGANYNSIFRNTRYQLSEQDIQSNIAYYNYTIRGLLDTRNRELHYDNSELTFFQYKDVTRPNMEDVAARKARFELQGHDKTLTLTHCRFEAKAVFGIDTVLVVDFDEFLYCPQGGANSNSQSQYIQEYLDHHRRNGVDQITIPQRFIANRTVSTKSCIIESIKRNNSLFDCLAPYYYYMGGHSIKSVHLGHKCPLTGYHQSCPTETIPRSYDCLCVNKNLRHILPWRGEKASNEDRECGFVHVSTIDSNYIKFTYPLQEILGSPPNEIGKIIYS